MGVAALFFHQRRNFFRQFLIVNAGRRAPRQRDVHLHIVQIRSRLQHTAGLFHHELIDFRVAAPGLYFHGRDIRHYVPPGSRIQHADVDTAGALAVPGDRT